MSTSTWKNGRSSCATAAHRDLESVPVMGQENVQVELKGGTHRKECHVHCPGVLSCLCCGAADTLVPCLPDRAEAAFSSLLPQEF